MSSIKILEPKIKKIEDDIDSFQEKIDLADGKMIKQRSEKENLQNNLDSCLSTNKQNDEILKMNEEKNIELMKTIEEKIVLKYISITIWTCLFTVA